MNALVRKSKVLSTLDEVDIAPDSVPPSSVWRDALVERPWGLKLAFNPSPVVSGKEGTIVLNAA